MIMTVSTYVSLQPAKVTFKIKYASSNQVHYGF